MNDVEKDANDIENSDATPAVTSAADERRRFVKAAAAGAVVTTIAARPAWGTNGSAAVSGASTTD